jgi:hypothetical protein
MHKRVLATGKYSMLCAAAAQASLVPIPFTSVCEKQRRRATNKVEKLLEKNVWFADIKT